MILVPRPFSSGHYNYACIVKSVSKKINKKITLPVPMTSLKVCVHEGKGLVAQGAVHVHTFVLW